MLKLRRGQVVSVDRLTVRIEGVERPAWADTAMVGEIELGDEVVVNTEALDLNLGSGGFDVIHANLTRGLAGGGGTGSHVIKLNYTSLQHPVEPVEIEGERVELPPMPVAVIPLHGHLAPAAWAAAEAGAKRVGYLQTPGGALPGSLSRDLAALRDRGLVCGHITAGPCHGGEHEAISVIGAIEAAAGRLEWDAAIAGPGPGILGSATRLGHGGMAALDTAHAALALGLPTILAPRLSSGDARDRHRGLSHHTETLLELLLGAVQVAAPDLASAPSEIALEALEALRASCADRHSITDVTIDLAGYAESGLPVRTMGRTIDEDPLFFAAALAAGRALAGAVPDA